MKADPRFSWLGFGDWSCTLSPDISDAICRKHDVAFASLQKFVGEANGNELDEAWNPRNKGLADKKMQTEITKYDCDHLSSVFGTLICSIAFGSSLADGYYIAVSDINDRNWPLTEQDISHGEINPEFIECAGPVPQIAINSNTLTHKSGLTFMLKLEIEKGCVQDITIEEYEKICVGAAEDDQSQIIGFPTCFSVPGNIRSIQFDLLLPHIDVHKFSYHISVAMRPANAIRAYPYTQFSIINIGDGK